MKKKKTQETLITATSAIVTSIEEGFEREVLGFVDTPTKNTGKKFDTWPIISLFTLVE